MSSYMITTMDNPWNPFTHFDEWYDWDDKCGYHTCRWIALFAKASIYLDDDTNQAMHDVGVDEFLSINPFGIHMKVYEDEADKLIALANASFHSSGLSKAEKNPTQIERHSSIDD